MEARVAKLEASLDHVSKDVTELRTDMKNVRDRLSSLETTVSHLPRKEYINGAVVALVLAMTALITFSEKLQGLVSP